MEFGYDFWLFIVRWLHVLSGVMWIGLFGTLTLYKRQRFRLFLKTYDLLS